MTKKILLLAFVALSGASSLSAQKLKKVTIDDKLYKTKETFYVKPDAPTVKQGEYKRKVGKLETIGSYVENERTGTWKSFGNSRELVQTIDFPNQTVNNIISFDVSAVHWTQTGDKLVEITPEQVPSFIGGKLALYTFINSLLRYPADARRAGIEGKAVISVLITKDGKFTDAKIEKDLGGGIGAEALRALMELPQDWIAGKINGQAADIRIVIPVTFRLG